METITTTVWTKSKLLIKGLVIGLLVLLLQIPSFYIRNLIEEREERQKEAISEVRSRWAGRQTLAGPVLVLPYWQFDGDTLTVKNRSRHLAYFLPDELKIHAVVTPQEKYRGIYKVMLYTSKTNLSGSFHGIQPEKLNIPAENISWHEAYLQFPVADARGLNEEVKMQWNNQTLTLAQASGEGPSNENLQSPLSLNGPEELRDISFSSEISLSGSEQLLFTPAGKSAYVTVSSTWPDPSFTGDLLPQNTRVGDSGFTASWNSLAYKRNFPQQWKDDAYVLSSINSTNAHAGTNSLSDASFGVNLFIPVNSYQKTMRSVKYAALCILLTFASFFLIETSNKKSVHPFQYGLVGLALVLFYTLLLSFSEYMGFNLAYAVASVFTIGLITWFVKGILASSRLSVILSAVLFLIYTYVFTILQLQDYALLLGSLGLFITLAVIMHFSKKIQW